MDSFFKRLAARATRANSLLCIGLDPHPDDLPAQTSEAVRDFCLRLVALTADVAAAFKPNVAFFEALGPVGIDALRSVIDAVPDGIPVILDAKRGDIASTARAYVRAVFQALGADAVTINPYLGYDAVEPFLENPARGVFLLCKTSNPGAADLQDLPIETPSSTGPSMPKAGRSLYESVALLAKTWNQRDNLGLVVGATQPEALARVRALAPELWILAPGVGAQGGDLARALRAGLRADGLGLLVPVSRGISRSADPQQAAAALQSAINQEREAILQEREARPATGTTLTPLQAAIARGLLAIGCVKFGEFTLKSGLQSPIYIDLRKLASHPRMLAQVAEAYLPLLNGLQFDRLAALPYAALPIGTAISLRGGWPMIYPRKEVKDYGTKAPIEGEFAPGDRVVVIDDLTTTGGSKFEAIEKLAAAGLQVRDVVVLVDRQSGAGRTLAEAGYRLHALFTLTRLLDHWEEEGWVPETEIQAVRTFLAG